MEDLGGSIGMEGARRIKAGTKGSGRLLAKTESDLMTPDWDGGSWAAPSCDRKKSTGSCWDGGSSSSKTGMEGAPQLLAGKVGY